MGMSHSNFSKKSREVKDSRGNLFNSPHLIDSTNTNEKQIKSFQELKPKWRELCSYFRHYPDHFIDFIKPPDCKIDLYFYQRIYLRIMMRYQKVYITATRGTSKSFLENLAFVLKCVMFPSTKLFICAPRKEQAAKISQERLNEIFEFYPLLRAEVRTYTESKDYTRLVFFNGSRYDVVQMTDASRGGRRHGGAVEEISDKRFDGDLLNSVVIPLCANDRIAMCGGVDSNELHKTQLYVTTAGMRQQFAYEKMKEVYMDMLVGKSAFNIGNGWELPCMHGQLDEDYVLELKESPTYALTDWLREYDSTWTGTSTDSLVAGDKLQKCRVVGVAEWEHCGDENAEYVLSYDVSRSEGRENALCALVVIKITPRGDGTYVKEVVNVFSREGEHSLLQAKFLKEKVREFKARILVVDTNGAGLLLADQLVMDLNDGNPPYSVVNDPRFDKYKLESSIPMVYSLKATQVETRQTDMVNNFMQIFNKLDIGLLKVPQEGIKSLERKWKRKIKDLDELSSCEIPYLLTNNMCEEILNLKYKQSGNDTKVDQVSKRIPKDKFSALMYGLWWIYMQERDNNLSSDSEYDFVFTHS